MKRQLLLGVLFCLAASASLGLTAVAQKVQTPPPGAQVAEAPDIKPGSWWEFRSLPSGPQYKLTVKEVRGPNMIVVRSDTGEERIYTREWNDVKFTQGSRALPIVFDPDAGFFSFPMWPGKKWRKDFSLQGGQAAGSGRTDGKALKWETVKVPAGEFLALEISVESVSRFVSPPATNLLTASFWYAPEARSVIKTKGLRDDRELVSYELK